MRMAPEALDHVAMSARLRCGVLEYPAQLPRSALDEAFGEHDGGIRVAQLLRMPQRHDEEGLFPRRLERGVVADLEPMDDVAQGLGVLCIRARRAAVERPRELVEHDD